MDKFFKLSFSLLQKLFLLLVIHWLYASFWRLHFLQPIWGIGIILALLLVFYFFPKPFKRLYGWLMDHKGLVMISLLLFQVLLLFSSQLMIRRDAAVVFRGAFYLSEPQSISNYLTRNPNNMPLFLYERFFYGIFGDGALWIMQGLNIFYVHLTSLILYKGVKRHYNQRLADLLFSFFLLILAFSPFFMAMYTDILILPLVAGQLVLALSLLKPQSTWTRTGLLLALGLVSALAMLFRPTSLILLIAFAGLLLLKKHWKESLISLAILTASFAGPYLAGRYLIQHQNQVELVKGDGLAKGPLLFINLGLTYSGTNQEDMKKGLLAYIPEDKREDYNNGMFATENVKKEIVRRLKAYNFKTFWQHMEYKQYWSVMDGTLDWMYFDDVSREKTAFVNPFYDQLKNPLTVWVRQHLISYDHPAYKSWASLKQMIWVLMALGLVLASLRFRPDDLESNFLILSVFGGLLFLAIFEGGKTRYLIQFLPQILLLSSLGWLRTHKWLSGLRGDKEILVTQDPIEE